MCKYVRFVFDMPPNFVGTRLGLIGEKGCFQFSRFQRHGGSQAPFGDEDALPVAGNADLTPLNTFVLPGGTPAAAWCHLARTVCRRAERDVVTLGRTGFINPQVVIYLNRLSDLLFVLARVCNEKGRQDVLWVPGKNRQP